MAPDKAGAGRSEEVSENILRDDGKITGG